MKFWAPILRRNKPPLWHFFAGDLAPYGKHKHQPVSSCAMVPASRATVQHDYPPSYVHTCQVCRINAASTPPEGFPDAGQPTNKAV